MTTTKREKLDAFLAKHPDPYEQYSISDIAREIAATRQWVHILLPGYSAERRRRLFASRDKILMKFLRGHPGALSISGSPGYVSILDMMAAMDLLPGQLRALLEKRGLRRATRTSAQRRRVISDRQRSNEARILRTERCVLCGRKFAWTGGMEKRFVLGGRTKTCSRACARSLLLQTPKRLA